jgi:hypothetical protein
MSDKPHKVVGYPVAAARPTPQPGTKIGGAPVGLPVDAWPRCGQCGSHMSFLLQLDLAFPLTLSTRFKHAFLFVCSGYEDDRHCETFYGENGASAIVLATDALAAPLATPEGAVERPERSIRWALYEPEAEDEPRDSGSLDVASAARLLAAWNSRSTPDEDVVVEVEMLHELPATLFVGGDPLWIQEPIDPQCPVCGGPMTLLAQVNAEIERWRSVAEPGYCLPFGGCGVGYLFRCQAECSPAGTYFCWQST